MLSNRLNMMLVIGVTLAMVFNTSALAQRPVNPIFTAIAEDDLTAIESYLADNGSAELREPIAHWTLLMYAASSGRAGIVAKLLEKKADPNLRDPSDWTALMYAARNNHPDCVKLLLDNGAQVDLKNNLNWTALMYAAIDGNEAIVKMLLNKGADPDAVCWNGRTALMYATGNDHVGTMQILLNRGAKTEIADSNGWTALMYSEQNARERATEVLREFARHQTDITVTIDASPPRPIKS